MNFRLNLKIVKTVFSAGLLLTFYGCAQVKGTAYLYPDGNYLKGPYSKAGEEGVFDNKSMRITVRQVKPAEYEDVPVLKSLFGKKNYIIFIMGIENKSRSRVIYNPALTVLTNDQLDYIRPLDYTDLYDLASGDSGTENALTSMKGKFFDLTMTLMPGEKASRLIIFGAFSKNVGNAQLAINEIYVGTDAINVSFPFILKYSEL